MESIGRHLASLSRVLKCSWKSSNSPYLRNLSTQAHHRLPKTSLNFESHNSVFPWRRASNSTRPDNAVAGGLGLSRALHLSSQATSLTNGIRTIHPTVARSGQQSRQIRVRVRNGNLEQALVLMQRKMISSGMERLIKRVTPYHVKDSEKRILARKRRERRQRSEELAKKLRSILIRKARGF